MKPKIERAEHAVAALCRNLSEIGWTVPMVHKGAVENLETSDWWTYTVPHFSKDSGLGGLAGYGLEFGFTRGDTEFGGRNSLRSYWEFMPSYPDMFLFGSRSNGFGRALFILARSRGIFVSQQAWHHVMSEERPNHSNRCTAAYNTYLVPEMCAENPSSHVIVLFSSYRGDALIASDVEESWDRRATSTIHRGPLPKGFGVVVSGIEAEGGRLAEVIAADYSPEITAAANYLSVCLGE